MKTRWFASFAMFGLLAACSSLPLGAGDTERLLVASGFQVRPADTPKRQASLASLPPYHLQAHVKDGKYYYVYADPKQQSLYVGGPTQYSAYQKLAVKENIATQNQMAAQENTMDTMDWASWGPWDDGLMMNPGVYYMPARGGGGGGGHH